MNIQEINDQISKLENLKKTAKNDLADLYRKDLKISTDSDVLIINPNFVSIKCSTFEDFVNCFNNCNPYETSHKIKHGSKNYYISSPFKFNIDNGYYNRVLRFEIKHFNNLNFWFSIDFKKLDKDFLNTFFIQSSRGLYSTETVHVNIPSHYKKFKDIKIESYDFKGAYLSWYGGNKTIIDCSKFSDLLEYLKK